MLKYSRRLRALGVILGVLFGAFGLISISAQETGVYSDPNGLFTMPIPEGWSQEMAGDFVLLTHDNGSTLLVGADESDLDSAKTALLEPLGDRLADAPTQSNDIPLPNGVWTQDLYLNEDESVVALITQFKEGVTYFMLLDSPTITATQEVTPALNEVLIGYTVGAPVDLSTATAAPLTDEDLSDLDAYIADALTRFDIPGASVAVVQNGEVIFSKGYGVTSVDDGQPVDADTLFMIGSTTKGMTSFLAATLVDEGKLDWDQPATDLLPDFALSDSDATSKIRYRDLLNMSSGVPRYDVPLFLEEADPVRIQAMVAEAELVAQPGELYNYSNQMVALGGFAAAVAAGSTFGPDIDEAYAELLQERLLDPIGMTRSTLDPQVALADENHATSYTVDVADNMARIPIDPSFERFASPVAPAGALWSSANDMARYLITQINLGVTPDGTRIVSEENLQKTHEAAIAAGPVSYGMGWLIGTWNGLTVLEHGGGTIGFVSDFSYIDEADLGVIVLANRTGSNSFTAAVREHVYETAYSLEHTADERFTAANESLNDMMMAGMEGVTLSPVEENTVTDYLGTYSNGLVLEYDEGLFLKTAYGRLPLYDFGEPNRYLVGGSMTGFGVELKQQDDQSTLTVGSLTDPSQNVTLIKE